MNSRLLACEDSERESLVMAELKQFLIAFSLFFGKRHLGVLACALSTRSTQQTAGRALYILEYVDVALRLCARCERC